MAETVEKKPSIKQSDSYSNRLPQRYDSYQSSIANN